MAALLLLLLLAASLTVRLAVLAGVADTTATTGLLGTTYHLHCVSHVSVSGAEYYVAAAEVVVGALQVGQVWLSASQMAMALASNTWKQLVTAAVSAVMGSMVIGQVAVAATASRINASATNFGRRCDLTEPT